MELDLGADANDSMVGDELRPAAFSRGKGGTRRQRILGPRGSLPDDTMDDEWGLGGDRGRSQSQRQAKQEMKLSSTHR
jgi:hypothetical protein